MKKIIISLLSLSLILGAPTAVAAQPPVCLENIQNNFHLIIERFFANPEKIHPFHALRVLHEQMVVLLKIQHTPTLEQGATELNNLIATGVRDPASIIAIIKKYVPLADKTHQFIKKIYLSPQGVMLYATLCKQLKRPANPADLETTRTLLLPL